jgi:lysophospholipase L1-like esterase
MSRERLLCHAEAISDETRQDVGAVLLKVRSVDRAVGAQEVHEGRRLPFIQFGINDGDRTCARHVGIDDFATAYSATTSGPVGDFFCDDHTHFSSAGAVEIADRVVQALIDQQIPLAAYLR